MAGSAQCTDVDATEKRLYALVRHISDAAGASLYPESVSSRDQLTFAMVRKGLDKSLLVLYQDEVRAADFVGDRCVLGSAYRPQVAKLCPLTHANAAALRRHLPFTAPVTLGSVRSIGMGDRLGIATPGHIRALRTSTLRPVLAQQSIREMTRIRRKASEVLDEVSWGVLQTGYKDGFGADADHLKTTDDIDTGVRNGFTMYTIDPSDYVDRAAGRLDFSTLQSRFGQLPWGALRTTTRDCRRRYAGKPQRIEGEPGSYRLAINARDLLQAAVKYGRALAHTAGLYDYLCGCLPREDFEFEVSIDETDAPTSLAEHFFIASELKRLGVRCDSLAPRFVGHFYKGIDYVGDVGQFRTSFVKHFLIAQHCGPYKFSLHSGSDKFAIYPIVRELAGDLLHVKTAGTSYLEALRAIAHLAPELFREIVAFARLRYPQDRATYHVSAELSEVPDPVMLTDEELPTLMDHIHARQICHVTFGSILTARRPDDGYLFRDRLMTTLKSNEELYYSLLSKHFEKHLRLLG